MSSQAVEVEILGKLTRVNCPAGQEEALLQAAKRLNDRLQDMTDKTKVTNEVHLLTIAALNFCYDLETRDNSTHEQQELQLQLNERMEKLNTSLDEALSKVQPGKPSPIAE
ncbi:cell division protein ZapA [Vibrio panuliri]|uniref:Cell division protein ZapA n=1 Tax=Vibrio panuliri TaxID=1381081 RepID=A0A1Q9HH16_9VIBR|nr:cell division protein ZapA [Vibrio panuliri]KAB1460059.1 cell division protein ZapA [Vibrio panuliri]OLQ89251.1 Z-ring-associated protein [Vibrio panuliri]OLQ96460.1 Z-ring-associated protein [Vibrio panuliri]